MATVDNTLEFELKRSSALLGELAAENFEPGVQHRPWGEYQERVDTFFESVVCPSPEQGNFKERYAKWKALMHSKLEMLDAHGSLGKELLSSLVANLWLVMLTPHTLWSDAAMAMRFPHLCYSWEQCKPWMEALRKLASILSDATEYMNQCAVMLDGIEGVEDTDECSTEISLLTGQNLSSSCQQIMTDVLEHSVRQAFAAFQGLKRRNCRFVVDVLLFIRAASEAKSLRAYSIRNGVEEVRVQIRISAMEPSAENPPPLHLHHSIRSDSSASKLTGFMTSLLGAMTDTTALWIQKPSEAITNTAQTAEPDQLSSPATRPLMLQGCQRCEWRMESKQCAIAATQVPMEAHCRVFNAFLETIAAFHGFRRLGDVLLTVQPCLMGRVVSILQHLGQADPASPEFLTLCCEAESSGESDGDGPSAVSHGCTAQAPRAMRVGAAVAVMLQVAVLQSQETRSLSGLYSAFWTVGTACALATRCLGKEVRAAVGRDGAEHSLGPATADPDDPGVGSTVPQEGATGQQNSLVRGYHGTAEQLFECARVAHSTMVEHTDQSVCISALKALKALVAVLEDASCVQLLEELLDVDMPQVQGQLVYMLQRRMHESNCLYDDAVWDKRRVAALAMAGLLRVVAEQEQSSDECSFPWIEQVGFEEPLVAAINLLRHHVIRRRVGGAASSFSAGFMEAIPRRPNAGTQGQDIAFVMAIVSRFQVVSRYAEQHVPAAVQPLSVLVYAAEALLEEMQGMKDERS